MRPSERRRPRAGVHVVPRGSLPGAWCPTSLGSLGEDQRRSLETLLKRVNMTSDEAKDRKESVYAEGPRGEGTIWWTQMKAAPTRRSGCGSAPTMEVDVPIAEEGWCFRRGSLWRCCSDWCIRGDASQVSFEDDPGRYAGTYK